MSFVGIWEFTWKIKKEPAKANSFSRQSNQMNPASDVIIFLSVQKSVLITSILFIFSG